MNRTIACYRLGGQNYVKPYKPISIFTFFSSIFFIMKQTLEFPSSEWYFDFQVIDEKYIWGRLKNTWDKNKDVNIHEIIEIEIVSLQ